MDEFQLALLLSLVVASVAGPNCNGTVCTASGVETFPTTFPDTATEIHITNSHLDYILSIQDLPSLTDLYLTANNIRFIGDRAFGGAPTLQKLILANNTISGIGNKTFNDLSALTFLDLSGNRLYEVGDDVFTGTQHLALEELVLSHSNIYVVSHSAIHDLATLNYVDFSYNEIQYVPRLTGCTQLTWLDLSFNDIYEVHDSPFSGLSNLEVLKLSHNDINSISPDTFKGLTKLRELYLSQNSLTSLGENPFGLMTELQRLDVSQNSLQTVAEETVMLDSMQAPVVHSNPLVCDCDVVWMRENSLIKAHNPSTSLVCAMPSSVSDTSLYEADIHAFDCPDPHHGFHSNTVALAVGLIVAVLFIVAGSYILYKVTTRKKIRRHTGSPSSSSPYSRVLFEGDSGNI